MHALLDAATAAFLEIGCSLLVGTATDDGEPMAARGWGCAVLENEPGRARLRVLLSVDDERGHVHARAGDRVAVTATSVRNLRSVQLKGAIRSVGAGDGADEARLAGYCEAFFREVHETDGTPIELVDRLRPSGVLAWEVEVEEAFDQTPGPGAGLPLPAPAP